MNWYIKVLQNYATFTGRARRTEFWMFNLINFIFVFLLVILDRITNLTFGDFYYEYMYEFFHEPHDGIRITDISDPLFNYGILTLFYSIFIFLPSLAVSVRRLHDIGKSGWMILINLIPIFGLNLVLHSLFN